MYGRLTRAVWALSKRLDRHRPLLSWMKGCGQYARFSMRLGQIDYCSATVIS